MHRSSCHVAVALTLVAVLVGCQHQSVAVSSQPALLPLSQENYCWWTLLLTTLPPDSVAARFQGSLAAGGLTNATWTQRADTAWAQAGPTLIPDSSLADAGYAARAVAYRHGDTTRFRFYVSVSAPSMGWPRTVNTQAIERQLFSLCGRIAPSSIKWSRPARQPTWEDSLSVWGPHH